MQTELQPSLSLGLPSSHSSGAMMVPLPQSGTQTLVEPMAPEQT
jgi:hypothetical protein